MTNNQLSKVSEPHQIVPTEGSPHFGPSDELNKDVLEPEYQVSSTPQYSQSP